MKANRFAEGVAIIGFIAGVAVANSARGTAFYVGAALALGSIVWYFMRGQYLTGDIEDPHAKQRKAHQKDTE
jgi:hypothetical protein